MDICFMLSVQSILPIPESYCMSVMIQMEEVSVRLGVPLSCIVPVKNYSKELELNVNCDILLLSAVNQMLRFADNYFDDIGDQLSDTEGNK